MTSGFLKLRGCRLHYIRKGKGLPVVMIHGSYSSINLYEMSIFDRVAEKYDAIAFDLPGFGKSTRKNLRLPLPDRAALIRQALLELGIEKPVMVGHSSGGALVLRQAIDFPDFASALVLIAPYVESYEKSHIFYRTVTAPVIGDLFYYGYLAPLKCFKDDTVFLRRSFYPSQPYAEYAKREVALAARRSSFRASAMDIQHLGRENAVMKERYREIRVPVSIVAGNLDVISRLDENSAMLHREIPHSRLTVLPLIGHTPMFTRPEAVLKAVDEVFSKEIPVSVN